MTGQKYKGMGMFSRINIKLEYDKTKVCRWEEQFFRKGSVKFVLH